MSNLKRMQDDDVRCIFDCLHSHGERPPPHLPFKIVQPGPDAMILSPPSYEFEDGLYVLLPPETKAKKKSKKKKKKGGGDGEDDHPGVPKHLKDLVMKEVPGGASASAAEECPWSLSGPQFPGTSSGIQQRYCYPQGRAEYSSQKGGALWTMVDDDKKEDTRYRILHVYLSPKRAANKGVPLSKDVIANMPSIRRKHQRDPAAAAASSAEGGGNKGKRPKIGKWKKKAPSQPKVAAVSVPRNHQPRQQQQQQQQKGSQPRNPSIKLKPRGKVFSRLSQLQHPLLMPLLSQARPLPPLPPPPMPVAMSRSSSTGRGGDGRRDDADSTLSFDMHQAPFISPYIDTPMNGINGNSIAFPVFPSADRIGSSSKANFVTPVHARSRPPPPPPPPPLRRTTHQQQQLPFRSRVAGQNVHFSPLLRGARARASGQSGKQQQNRSHRANANSNGLHLDGFLWNDPLVIGPTPGLSDLTGGSPTPSTSVDGESPPAALEAAASGEQGRRQQEQQELEQPAFPIGDFAIESQEGWREYLDMVQALLRGFIMATPVANQGECASILADWARHVAADPLQIRAETAGASSAPPAAAAAHSAQQGRQVGEQRKAGSDGTAGPTAGAGTTTKTAKVESPSPSPPPVAGATTKAVKRESPSPSPPPPSSVRSGGRPARKKRVRATAAV